MSNRTQIIKRAKRLMLLCAITGTVAIATAIIVALIGNWLLVAINAAIAAVCLVLVAVNRNIARRAL